MMKLGNETGSLINHLMSSGASWPKAGEGATLLYEKEAKA